ncbi:MAG: SDR family NAD(P)-dependent oxidoreductase, partial [Candidatus Poribacteria bacterium]|nr:SDR family NAD(P)-dependent oxidoreductase [Candidatus Poribacteria bacterium]
MLEGKTALISGGGTGIGRATGLRLAAEGANIVVNYSRSVDDAIQTQRDIEALGRGCMIYQADVSVDDQVREMADAAIKEFKRLDILVNSA